ncbi:MAG: Crp/Fnr family transcriptional regulator [Saprospiraceae bacterium]|nr:Crp/Fnr family transcriptional regulator [Saprospiraceae bacterium]MBP9195054.1 Crp/Fnr family transcriptional regulator [Saprospiraceae bacterium]
MENSDSNRPISSGCQLCRSRMRSVFSHLHTADLQLLDSCRQEKEYKAGELIFKEGSYPKGLYCVGKGKIKVTHEEELGFQQILHLAGEGDVMGYRAILAEDTFSCSASALENSRICFIPRSSLYTLLETNARLALRLAQLLAGELKKAELKITDHSHRPVKSRIALGIEWLSDRYGMEGNTIKASLKRSDLAHLAGTTRETATRILYDLQAEGIIQLDGRRISIIDKHKLHQLTSFSR